MVYWVSSEHRNVYKAKQNSTTNAIYKPNKYFYSLDKATQYLNSNKKLFSMVNIEKAMNAVEMDYAIRENVLKVLKKIEK